ncbi:two component transcriptional regulator, LytTR family [Ruminiclostridium papyrosolvens DSM 2782]|uniref:Stage 0 sporulation protein A homolog n=1 Tax=Ruminiclostridium papyrosolvens DSM 2782 TaxID=588581 RepID=F1T8K1_9FIRM|nr:LytTR family DNA-binding domain-containing protein [Ruminiclostridium papyrosolvens]EGD49799.1 two component transcriptional regulator, LytTR family [Ruminiclostridium papyrosolvens DSM 2782]WES33073.1 LytTR family DNA-binding domain-containing protein [Ruminiclostridium papyrosolvens DSM 2782]
MELKVLIVDDDDGMRLVLKKIIEKNEGFELVGEAKSGETGLGLVEAFSPHIVFLDIEMPGMGGIECAKRIMDIAPKTFIIFATAYENYMPEAFEVYASDYLIKPFKIDRILTTLQRIKEIFVNKEADAVSPPQINRYSLSKLIIKSKEGISFIDCKDIIFIERENRNTVIHTLTESLTTSEGLSEIEERLDNSHFFRSHKSYIINLSMIYKIYPYGRWTYTVKFKGTDKDALLTHDRYGQLEKLFNA